MTRYIKAIFSHTTFLVVVMILAASNQAFALSRAEVKQIIVEEAHNSSVPPALALAVAKVESDFNPTALSSAGARGVMQIMPQTAKGEFGVEEGELWKARLNIQLGIDYLAKLHRQYGGKWNLALSHYNGGTLKGRGAEAEPHSYTANYVRLVQRWQQRYAEQNKIWAVAFNDARSTPKEKWQPIHFDQNDRLVPKISPWQESIENESASKSEGRTKSRITVFWQDRLVSKRKQWFEGLGSGLEERRQKAARSLDDFSAMPRSQENWLNG